MPMTSRDSEMCSGRLRRHVRGATLIEVLIAVVILAIGLLGYAALQSTSLQAGYSAYLRSQATWLASDIIDQMRSHRADALDGAYCSARWDRDLWEARLTAVLGPGATGTVVQPWSDSATAPTCGASEEVEIRITWNDARGDIGNDGEANLQTFIFRTEL